MLHTLSPPVSGGELKGGQLRIAESPPLLLGNKGGVVRQATI
jgi:hypothetical protein